MLKNSFSGKNEVCSETKSTLKGSNATSAVESSIAELSEESLTPKHTVANTMLNPVKASSVVNTIESAKLGHTQECTGETIDEYPQVSRDERQLEYLEKVTLDTLWKHSASFPFQTPVDAQLLNLPDYLDTVKHPMDLGTIKRQLSQGHYKTAVDCICDFNLIFSNCYTYTKPNTAIQGMCVQLERVFLTSLANMPQQNEVCSETKSTVECSNATSIADHTEESPTAKRTVAILNPVEESSVVNTDEESAKLGHTQECSGETLDETGESEPTTETSKTGIMDKRTSAKPTEVISKVKPAEAISEVKPAELITNDKTKKAEEANEGTLIEDADNAEATGKRTREGTSNAEHTKDTHGLEPAKNNAELKHIENDIITKAREEKMNIKTAEEMPSYGTNRIMSIADKVKMKSNERATKAKFSKENNGSKDTEEKHIEEKSKSQSSKETTKANLNEKAVKTEPGKSPRSASSYMNKLKQTNRGQPLMAGVRGSAHPAEKNNNGKSCDPANRKRKLSQDGSSANLKGGSADPKKKKVEILSVSLLPPRPQLSRYESQLEYLEKVTLSTLWKHSASWPFQTPVDAQGLNIPDYLEIVKRPMDLGTIKRQLSQRHYKTADDCIRDFNLVFSNCYTYNKPNTGIWGMCQQLERVFMTSLAHMPQQLRLRSGLRVGMKLEAEDRANDLVCCATVAALSGDMIRVHYDGWPDEYDFWCHPWASIMHPVGYCLENEVALSPPKTWKNIKTFTWEAYLKKSKSTTVPARLLKPNMVPYGFAIGWKLEAEDDSEKLVCCATVVQIRDCDLRIHYDGWEDEFDFWCHPYSDSIHPVGWCKENGLTLSPPKEWREVDCFTWEAYLKQTHSLAVPKAAFEKRKGFAPPSAKPSTDTAVEPPDEISKSDVASPALRRKPAKPEKDKHLTSSARTPSGESKKLKPSTSSDRTVSTSPMSVRSCDKSTPPPRKVPKTTPPPRKPPKPTPPPRIARKSTPPSRATPRSTPPSEITPKSKPPPRTDPKTTSPARIAPKRPHVLPVRYQEEASPEHKAIRLSSPTPEASQVAFRPTKTARQLSKKATSILSSSKKHTAKLPTVEVSPIQKCSSDKPVLTSPPSRVTSPPRPPMSPPPQANSPPGQISSALASNSPEASSQISLLSSRAQLASILNEMSSSRVQKPAPASQATSPPRTLRQLIVPAVSTQASLLRPVEPPVVKITPKQSLALRPVAVVQNQTRVPAAIGRVTSPLSSLSNSPLFSPNIPDNSVVTVAIRRATDTNEPRIAAVRSQASNSTRLDQPLTVREHLAAVSGQSFPVRSQPAPVHSQLSPDVHTSTLRSQASPLISVNANRSLVSPSFLVKTVRSQVNPVRSQISPVLNPSTVRNQVNPVVGISSARSLVCTLNNTSTVSNSVSSSPAVMAQDGVINLDSVGDVKPIQIAPQPEMRVPERINSILSNVQMLSESDVRNVLQMAASRLSAHAQIDLAQMLLRWNNDILPPRLAGCPCVTYKPDKEREQQVARLSFTSESGGEQGQAYSPLPTTTHSNS